MTLVFPLLLGGLVLTGVPVLLHLIVRQKPKRLPFPAFRFLVQQHRANQRKLRLRHLLLLALRIFLIAAMCLVLARPRLFHRVLGLDAERPVQAVLLFDTSASMEYRSSDGVSRLAEAKQRGHELLGDLPPGSQVAVVDSANARFDQPLDWKSVLEARKRIDDLKIRNANAPVTQTLLKVLGQLGQSEPEKADQSGPARLRLLVVLSDRTRGCWDGAQLPALIDKLDRVPPVYDGLLAARGQIGPLKDLLAELRTRQAGGKDLGEQTLTEALSALQDELVALPAERQRWPVGLPAAVQQVRRLCRDMLAQMGPAEPTPGDPGNAASARVRPALGEMLRATSGAQLLFFDVGIESPVDLALGAIELPRTSQGIEQQLFADGDTFPLNVDVHAIGKDAPAKVICQVGDGRQEFDAEVKAGQRQRVPFKIGEGKLVLQPGDNPIEVRLAADRAAMPHGQRRFATVRVRPRRKIVVLVDDADRAGYFAKVLTVLGNAPDVRKARGVTKDALSGAAAVYLVGVAAPEESLWKTLGDYVKAGGGLGIVPAGAELSRAEYNQPAAQVLMPGKIEDKLDGKLPAGSDWDWVSAKYTHSFMTRFKGWKEFEWTDFIRLRRGALNYWDVAPYSGKALVLIAYDDGNHKPAVLDRLFDAKSGMQGKTLLFTTPLDEQQPPWNNYMENVAPSFYVGLLSEATAYLAGESALPQLNFVLGQGDPVVTLPAGPALESVMKLREPDRFTTMTREPGQSHFVLKDLDAPGTYQIDGRTKDGHELTRLVAFSLNVPALESDLSKVPAAEIEPLFAGGALLSLNRQDSLRDALQSYRSEPLDLMPYFMLALLFALALENLLANKFYRQAEGT
jgi:hypothetical protein